MLTVKLEIQLEFSFKSLELAILGARCKSWYLPYRLTEVPWNMAKVMVAIIFFSKVIFELFFSLNENIRTCVSDGNQIIRT